MAINHDITMSWLHNVVSGGKAPRAVCASALVFNLMDRMNDNREQLGLPRISKLDFVMGSYDADTEIEYAEAKRLIYGQHLFQKYPRLGMLFIDTYVFMRKYTLGTKLFGIGEDVFWTKVQWLLGFLGKSVGSGHNYLLSWLNLGP